MADANIKWNYSITEIKARKGFNSPFYRACAETLARYCDPFVPFREGILASDYTTFTDEDTGYVRYNQIYAHFIYTGTGLNFNKEQHPLATSYWDLEMMRVKGPQYIDELNRLRKRFSE